VKVRVLLCGELQMGYVLVNRFNDHLQVVTTNNYNTIAEFHTINHSMLSLLSLLSLVVTWNQLSTMAIPSAMFSLDVS
jgi:hypothetical protein